MQSGSGHGDYMYKKIHHISSKLVFFYFSTELIRICSSMCFALPHCMLALHFPGTLRRLNNHTAMWYLYFGISLFLNKQLLKTSKPIFFPKVSPPFSNCTMPWSSRQAISPQRPDNYRDCWKTSKRPEHKSLRAQ